MRETRVSETRRERAGLSLWEEEEEEDYCGRKRRTRERDEREIERGSRDVSDDDRDDDRDDAIVCQLILFNSI